MKIDVPEDYMERFITMETMMKDVHKGWTNGGSPAVKRLSTKLDGLVLCASILVLGFCGWVGWLTCVVIPALAIGSQ